MKILIGPLSLPGKFSINWSLRENPGMGASEFHSIILASILCEKFEVVLWVSSGSITNASFQVVQDFSKKEDYDLQIAFTANWGDARLADVPLIALSHHPFDELILDLPPRTILVSNVGRYQLFSNSRAARRKGLSQIWLPLFLPESRKALNPAKVIGSKVTVGHISSLHPSKGFHDVLGGFLRFERISPVESELRVLGGINLYGLQESHSDLPVEETYGDRLIGIMGGSVPPNIKFLGRRTGGVSKEIVKWDVAVLNPKGFGESESVSMKDCWREGVPVIAGNYFGQRDYMRFFPELKLDIFHSIPKTLKKLCAEPELLTRLSLRSHDHYELLVQRGEKAAATWLELVLKVASRDLRGIENCGLPLEQLNLEERMALMLDAVVIAALKAKIRIQFVAGRMGRIFDQ